MVELCINRYSTNKGKITNLKERSKIAVDWGIPLRRRRSTLDCSTIEEEEEEEEKEEENKKKEKTRYRVTFVEMVLQIFGKVN